MTRRASTLLALYDFASSPITFDFFNFLISAEMRRQALGLECLHLAFVPGDNGQFFAGFGFDDAEKSWRVQNILLPGAALLPSCRQVTLCPDRHAAQQLMEDADEVFPPDYDIATPSGFYEQVELITAWACGREIPSLVVPEAARSYVRRYLDARAGGRRAIVITLRQASYSTQRNSNVAAWATFARGLDPERYFAVFVPDIETMFDAPDPALDGFAVFGEATANLLIRAALYELAFVNLMKGNGPGQLALLNRAARLVQFVGVAPNSVDTNEDGMRSSMGINPGDQYPYLQPYQKLAWCDDRTANIAAEFAKFEAYADGRADVSDFNPRERPDPRAVADLLGRAEKPTQAQEILEHLAAEREFDPELSLALARLETRRERYADAWHRLETLMALGYDGVELDECAGDTLTGLARLPDAARAYERALLASDGNDGIRARLAIKLGWLLVRLGQIGQAERHARSALSGGASDRLLLRFLGEIWTARGDAARAAPYIAREIEILRAVLDEAARRGENDDPTAIRLAALHAASGRFEESHRLLAPIIARNPQDWGAREGIADALAGLGRRDEAVAHYEAAIVLTWERQAGPLFSLARLRLEAGDLDLAERHIERCIHLAPQHGPAYELLADILMRQNRPRDSLQALVRARELMLG